MAVPGKTSAIIVASLIIVLGIIHLGVGIGIVAKYHQYDDVFRQTVGLSGFNIVIGFFAIAVGIVCMIAVIRELIAMVMPGSICSAVLGIFAIASLIAALAINSQSVSYMRSRLLYRIDTYINTASSISIVDNIQSHYQCCGVNLWLEWANVGLGTTSTTGGSTSTGTGTASTGTGTGTVSTGMGNSIGSIVGTNTTNIGASTGIGTAADKIKTNTETGNNDRKSLLFLIGTGRRRRHLDLPLSPLIKGVRQRRQTSTGSTTYNLPSTYSINLPLSCCINGGVTSGNTVGGYCVFNAGNSSTTSFYVQGCLPTIANIAVAQITGIAVINVCLAILAIVFIPVFMNMFPATSDPNNSNNKQPVPNGMPYEQQMQNGGYYANNNDPNAYYNYPQPTYAVYQ